MVVHAGIIPGIFVEAMDPYDLLHMRNIEGRLQPHESDAFGEPWVNRWQGPFHVVFGHDSNRGLQRTSFATGLDTGCVYGLELTALIMPENEIISVQSTQPRW